MCLHQDRGMPQQDKMLWNFRLLLFASSKGNNVLATHVESPVASMESFCRPKPTRLLMFATPMMQLRDQQIKGWIWIYYWSLDLVKLDLPRKSSFMILNLLI